MATSPEQRYELEVEQIIADIRLKNRQTQTEVWKVAIAAAVAGVLLGGLLVQVVNMAASSG